MKKIVPILLIILCFSACKKSETVIPSVKTHEFSEAEIQKSDTLDEYFKMYFIEGDKLSDTLADYSISLSYGSYYGDNGQIGDDSIIYHFGIIRSDYSLYFYRHLSSNEVEFSTDLLKSVNDVYDFFSPAEWTGFTNTNDLKTFNRTAQVNISYQGMTFTSDEKYDSKLQFKIYRTEVMEDSAFYIYGRFSGKLYDKIGDAITISDAIFKSKSYAQFYINHP